MYMYYCMYEKQAGKSCDSPCFYLYLPAALGRIHASWPLLVCNGGGGGLRDRKGRGREEEEE